MIVNKSLSLSGPQFPPVLSLPLWGSNEVMYRPPGSLWVFHKCDLSFLSLDPAPCPYSPNTDVRKRALSPLWMGTPTQHGQRNSSPPHHCQLQPSRGHLCSERGFPPPYLSIRQEDTRPYHILATTTVIVAISWPGS